VTSFKIITLKPSIIDFPRRCICSSNPIILVAYVSLEEMDAYPVYPRLQLTNMLSIYGVEHVTCRLLNSLC
jgi:hypothetical protein